MSFFPMTGAILALVFALVGGARASEAGAGSRRIVFVGDSITGQGRNRAGGYVNEMEKALLAVRADTAWSLVALGGSGQSVGTWAGVEKDSRTREQTLDVPGIEVRKSLDQPADVLVVMLGMNDVIAPYVDESDASLDRWVAEYEKLVVALKQRSSPKTTALGGITLCTEDPASPKNRLIDHMNIRVQALAKKLGATYLPTAETVKSVLAEGRKGRADFHASSDFVHPDDAGHLGIAVGMLDGLGESAAAGWLHENRLAPLLRHARRNPPAPSWELLGIRPDSGPGRFAFTFRSHWPESAPFPAGGITVTPPEGWTASPAILEQAGETFTLTGAPERLHNTFTLAAAGGSEDASVKGRIAAPWLVAPGLVQAFWNGDVFEPQKARSAVDEALEKNEPFLGALPGGLEWRPLFPSPDYSGGKNASNVDFFAVTHPENFEGGYAARWIRSERKQETKLKLNTQMFAGQVYLEVRLNGHPVYAGQLEKEPGKTKVLDITLEAGWNTLVIKSNHRCWLWQFSAEILPDDGSLRYAIHPPSP